MQVQVLDESASKKTTTAASTKVGENYYYKPTMIIMGDAKAKKEVDEALRNFAINHFDFIL